MNKKEFQIYCENALLASINAISKAINEKCFDNFNQIYNNIFTFSINFFKKYKKVNEPDIENIDTLDNLIEILSKKEPKFKTLILNFKDEKLKKSSTILFYTTFLNTFFLEESRDDLFKRCKLILLKEGEMIDLLTDWETYIALLRFTHTKYVKDKTNLLTIIPDDETLPNYIQIIDKDFLVKCCEKKKLPDAIFYQLQFLFNEMKQKKDFYGILLCLLTAVSKIKQIKLDQFTGKSYQKLVEKIKYKNVSLKLQNKYANKLKNKPNIDVTSSNDDYETSPWSSGVSSKYSSFADRFNKLIIDQNKNIELNFESIEEFWSQSDDKKVFENGILFNQSIFNQRKEKSTERWKEGIQAHLGYLSSSNVLDYEFRQKGSIIETKKLYKIFFYDENLSKWRINPEFNQILNSNNDTTLIYFYNSYEEDIKTVKSTLTNCKYDEEGETDEIVVYLTICDNMKNFFNLLEIDKDIENTTPLILQLHVPPRKQEDPNLKNIILQISTFLTFISNINIVILNKDHYEDQIDMIIELANIKRSYQESLIYAKEQISSEKVLESDFFPDIDDYLPDELKNHNSSNENINVVNTEILLKLTEKVFQKFSKHVLLFNDRQFKYTNNTDFLIQQNGLISSVKNQIFSFCSFPLHCIFIYIDDSSTYKGFIDSLITIVDEDNPKTRANEMIQIFECIELADMPMLYFDLKKEVNENQYKEIRKLKNKEFGDKTEEEIKKNLIIYQKMKEKVKSLFNFIKNKKLIETSAIYSKKSSSNNNNDIEEDEEESTLNVLNDFSVLLDVQKEIYSKCPPMDVIFYYIATLVIEDENQMLYQQNSKIDESIKNLKKCSKEHLKYLKDIIKSKPNWSKEDKNNVKLCHVHAMKEDFYNILCAFYPLNKVYELFYAKEKELNNIIKSGIEELDDIFNEIRKENIDRFYEQREKIKDRIKQGTNYHIRETEAEAETELTLTINDGDNLSNYIDQDY